jgi:hypothetical protein
VRRRNGGDGRGGGSRRFPNSGLRRAAALAAILWTLVSCATGVPRRKPATAARAAEIGRRWEVFREAVLARPAEELFYEARIRRSVLSGTFVAAVRDDPGRSLAVVVEGPLGAPVARARWDGQTTRIEREGRAARDSGGSSTLAELGLPLSARALSLLLFGLPDTAPPETIELAGDAAWLTWRGGAVACAFADARGTVERVLFREADRQVDIRYAEWNAGVPTRIAMAVSGGGRAELVVKPGETGP